MRFRVGFCVGCAAGAWVASKASQLKRAEQPRADWPRVASSRAEAVSAEAAAERLRALGDLAREAVSGLVAAPFRGVARARMTQLLSSSLLREPAGDEAGERWGRA